MVALAATLPGYICIHLLRQAPDGWLVIPKASPWRRQSCQPVFPDPTLPGRDCGVDYEAEDQWLLEQDCEYARQNPELDPVTVEGTGRSRAQIKASARE
jgi:hypothetical protein